MFSAAQHACATKLLHCGECRRMTAASPDAPDTPTLCAHMRAATLPLLRTSQARITSKNCQVSVRQSLFRRIDSCCCPGSALKAQSRQGCKGPTIPKEALRLSLCLMLCNYAQFLELAQERKDNITFSKTRLPVLSACTGRLDCSAYVPCYASPSLIDGPANGSCCTCHNAMRCSFRARKYECRPRPLEAP